MKERLVSYDRVMRLIEEARYHLEALVKVGQMPESEAEIMDKAYRILYETMDECKDDMIIDLTKEEYHGRTV